MRGKGKGKETEEKKDGRSEENSKGVGNLRWRRRSSKIRERGKKTGPRKVLPMDQGIWKETIWKNTN